MSIRKRLGSEDSRRTALEAARALLLEAGPQAVTLKAVAGRIGRTHETADHSVRRGVAEGTRRFWRRLSEDRG